MDFMLDWDAEESEIKVSECEHDLVVNDQSIHCLTCGYRMDTALMARKAENHKESEIILDPHLAITGTVKDQQKYIDLINNLVNSVHNQDIKLSIPANLFPEIANRLMIINNGSSQHRGMALYSIIAAITQQVISERGIFIEDNKLASIFRNPAGISGGRNMLLMSMAALNMNKGIHMVTDKDPYLALYSAITACCERVGEQDYKTRVFIVALATINDLTEEVESQVPLTRFGGSYLYYRLAYTGAICEEIIKLIISSGNTTPESIRKFFVKLQVMMAVIDRIALKIGIISAPSDLAKLTERLVYKYKVKK